MRSRFRLRLAIGIAVCSGLALAAPSPRISAGFESRLLLLDAVSTGKHFVAAGERGFILFSQNGWQWRAARSGSTATLTALTHRGASVWATGHDATILKSSDGGLHWRRVHFAPEAQSPLLDIAFVDDKHGFAVGAYGSLLETYDAGEHWQPRKISDRDLHYNAIAVLNPQTLLIAGEAGTVLRSTDAGQTWHALASPYAGSWFGIAVLDAQSVLLFGLRGQLYRSEDAGAHWTALPARTTAALLGGRVLADGRVVVAGNDGVLLISDDRARSFRLYHQSGNPALATLLADKHHWWLFGERGVMRVAAPR